MATRDAGNYAMRARSTVAGFMFLMAGYTTLCLADSRPPTYASPEEAVSALLQSVEHGDEQQLRAVLGAGSELVDSGDVAADKQDREQFVQGYLRMHRLSRQSDGSMILYIGAENWPFPVPIVPSHGRWRFDTDTGAMEVLFRRIGEDELAAIQVCHALVEESAGHGTDGPESAPPEADGVIKALLTEAPGSDNVLPFDGYYFRRIERTPDNFTVIAYPVTYRSSGIMTFIVNRNNVVYERDLGLTGAEVASKMGKIQLDSKWAPAE